jgi:NAD(P)-dependent dehydrogenase (short-subunit alcohol dehydrogenase family)
MPGRVEDKVAFITGAARGQGRSHAVRLAAEGADIIAVDLCDQVDSVPYLMATPTTWRDMIDTNLTGVWHAAKAAIPHLRAGDRGGSIILTSSTAGLMALENTGHYTAAKHGVVGLMRTLALELAPDMIRVNSVHPTSVNTDMTQNSATYALFAPDLDEKDRTKERLMERFQTLNALPIPWVEPVDISNAVLWLASDESRYVTGVTLPVDASCLVK